MTWIPITERHPTANDADETGRVWVIRRDSVVVVTMHHSHVSKDFNRASQWMPREPRKIPEPPE